MGVVIMGGAIMGVGCLVCWSSAVLIVLKPIPVGHVMVT